MAGDSLVEAWITYQSNWWAYEAIDELINERPEEALRAIENIAHRVQDNLNLLGVLAAGPLEDLLATHGEAIIDAVEIVAREDVAMRRCLAGVWQNAMSDEVFARVQRAAEPNFKFPVS